MTGTDQASNCYRTALRLLNGKDYTAQALQCKLLLRQFSTAAVKAALDRLSREGFLNDRRYTEHFVTTARENGRFTGIRLRQELQKRGVSAELIDEFLQESPDEHTELEHARTLVSRRYRSFDPEAADDREKRRIALYLQRRGYAVSLIMKLFNQCVKR